MQNFGEATVVSVIFLGVLVLTSAAGLIYGWLGKNHQPHLWPNPVERGRAMATLRYYRDVHDSSD